MDGGAYCCMSAIFDTQNHVRVALRRIKLNIASYVCIAVDNLTTQLACSLASIPTLFNIVFKLTIKECIGKQVPEALSVRKGEERKRIMLVPYPQVAIHRPSHLGPDVREGGRDFRSLSDTIPGCTILNVIIVVGED